MSPKIVSLVSRDVRFPTSRTLAGSDSMNVDPDYSAAYVMLKTDGSLEGHGHAFTCGRGTEVVTAAIRALAPHVVGRSVDSIVSDFRGFWRSLAQDSQLRWLGPERGAIHLATAAIVNAVWDLFARSQSKPLWKLLADLPPDQIISAIDFTYMTDALTPEEARDILGRSASTKAAREAQLLKEGFPAYTTSPGWLGYPIEKVRSLSREAVRSGFSHIKMKVGAAPEEDQRRAAAVREEIGPDRKLMMDANQRWDVGEAIRCMKALARFDPWWIEEPTSPDDVLGHAEIARAIRPIGVATGEAASNRIIFKQLLQAGAIRFCQIDGCRLGGVNEVLAVLLLAAKFRVPVCPHAGGVGLCEFNQHFSIFDHIAVSADLEGRVLEYLDNLHEHFADPVVVERGRYRIPLAPGNSVRMLPESLDEYSFPDGPAWR